MGFIADNQTSGSTEPWAVHGIFKTTAAVTKGYAVSIDTSGTIALAATATLHFVIGIAAESAAAGEDCRVLLMGYCDYAVTDEGVTAPVQDGTGDQVLQPVDGGVMEGQTGAEINANDTQLGGQIVGKNLAADTGAVGICWVTAGAIGTYGGDNA